jgi:hypothetical protein
MPQAREIAGSAAQPTAPCTDGLWPVERRGMYTPLRRAALRVSVLSKRLLFRSSAAVSR